MDAAKNPYSPGAGILPPELAGRDTIREQARIAMERTRLCRPERGLILTGLRGVGKTVLLVAITEQAKATGIKTVFVEAPEDRTLPEILVPELRAALLQMSSNSEKVQRALSALLGFARAWKVTINPDGGIGVEWKPEPGLADSGDLNHDLPTLLEAAGEAAQTEKTALVLLIDELQYVKKPGLTALCAALHRIGQLRLPVLLIGAGLPQLHGQLGRAKSYAERQFHFITIGALSPEAAREAIAKPAQAEEVKIEQQALENIVTQTKRYPYFLQEWGKHVWNKANASPIQIEDVRRASETAIAELDAGFFSVRYDRLTPSERKYLWAMAKIGDRETYRTSDIADILQKEVTKLGPTRANLINKGMAYSPAYGDIAFTVPLFGEFILRRMPDDN